MRPRKTCKRFTAITRCESGALPRFAGAGHDFDVVALFEIGVLNNFGRQADREASVPRLDLGYIHFGVHTCIVQLRVVRVKQR